MSKHIAHIYDNLGTIHYNLGEECTYIYIWIFIAEGTQI